MSFELEVIPMNDEVRAFAEKDLRETPENVRNGIDALRKYIEEDKKLHSDTSDEFLILFLRPCKFYPESAYQLMKRVADYKQQYASILDNLLPNDEKEVLLGYNLINVLVDRDHKRRRIMLINCGKEWDPSKVAADQLLRVLYIIHGAAIYETETQVRGSVVIMDFNGLSMKQVMGLSPFFCMKLLTFIQDAMLLRLKEVHFVKQSFIFNLVWNMFKPFIREKLRKRIFFHGSKMSSLHKFIPPSHLPEDYGGELPKINYTSADWCPTLLKYEDKMRVWNNIGYHKKE